MVAAVRVHKTGGPEVLTFEQIDIPAPGPGQIKLKQHACGVNYIDTYFRMGMYPSPVGLPFTSGNEGAGEVIAVGPGVADIKVGDRVGYVVALGGYAQERVMPADRAVKLPDGISYEQAAAMMLKGMTAQYLLRRTYNVNKGDTILVPIAAIGAIPAVAAFALGVAGASAAATSVAPLGRRTVRRIGAISGVVRCCVVTNGTVAAVRGFLRSWRPGKTVGTELIDVHR